MSRYPNPTGARVPAQTPKGWWWRDGQDPEPAEAPTPQLTETDNPIIATLLGPDGEPIRQWRERAPMGFRKREETP